MEEQAKYEARQQQQYFQKCIDDFVASAVNLIDTIYTVCKMANPGVCPREIVDGVDILPVYIFMKVLKAQGGSPSSNQSAVIDVYFKKFDPGFQKYEFIESLHSNNNARQKMKALIGISETFVGTFWIALFKAMYVTKSDEETLKIIMKYFTTAIVRFAVLGNVQEHVITAICEKFVNALHKQILECRKLPESQIDFFGEASPNEHLRRMSDIAFSLYNTFGDPEGPDMNEMFPHFIAGLLHGFINKSSMSITDKGKLLEELMQRFSIDVSLGDMRFSGPMLFTTSTENNGFKELLRKMQGMVVGMPPIMFQYIVMYTFQSGRNDDSMAFMSACTGFLLGVEKELTKEYPFYGFGNLSGTFLSGEFDKVGK
jgi:uncharacterized membrane protein SpoIIM required for sporulation